MCRQQIGPQLHRQLLDAEQAALRVQLFQVRRITARGLIALYRVTQKRQVWGPHQQSNWRTTA